MDPHELYGLPLERFVAERSALTKELRAEGRREEAATAAKLTKPTVAAWAVNQLVRTQHRAIAELFVAGDALQRAQGEVIAGRGSAVSLREAAERERAAVATLASAARGLLTAEGEGLTPSTVERVTETLHAAALDPAARDKVRDGCLTRELKHIGLGAATGAVAAPPPAPSAEKTAAARERQARLEAERKARAEAQRAAERASVELERAQERRDRAAESLREAEHALTEARARAAEATRALRDLG